MSKPTFTAGPVSITTTHGWRDKDGYRLDALPVLAVTPSTEKARAWVVTHIPTGRTLTPDVDEREAAEWAAWYLATEGDRRGIEWAGGVLAMLDQARTVGPLIHEVLDVLEADGWRDLAPWLAGEQQQPPA